MQWNGVRLEKRAGCRSLSCYGRERLWRFAALPEKPLLTGEYVFDWAWANAYRRYGYPYYPKLLSAVPFSPVTGRRLLAQTRQHRAWLILAAMKIIKERGGEGISSFHCLFPQEYEAREMEEAGMTLRHGIQFHWQNRIGQGYKNFEMFLAGMKESWQAQENPAGKT